MVLDTKIAGVYIRFIGEFNKTFVSRLNPYKSKIKGDDFIFVEYTVSDDISLPETYTLIKKSNDRTWYYNDENYFCYSDFNIQINKFVMSTAIKYNHIKITTYNFSDKDEIDKISNALKEYKMVMPNPKERENIEDIRFEPDMPLLNSTDQAIRYSLLYHNVFSIHSSAIAYKNSGIVFSAPSGTGKSTHTSLWRECFGTDVSIINDDSPFIRIEEDKITLYGAPWAGASGINNNISVDLKAIVFLEQAKENSISKLMTLPALQKLLNEILIPKDKEMLEKVYALLNLLLSNVPCYVLRCLPNKESVLIVKNMIFDDKGE